MASGAFGRLTGEPCARSRNLTRNTQLRAGRGWGIGLVVSNHLREKTAKVYRVDPGTGKMELWKAFGEGMAVGVTGVGGPHFSSDGSAYAYLYGQALSQAYVVKGLK